MHDSTTYVALDAHKKEHAVSMLLPGRDRAEEWTVRNTAAEIRRMVRRIRRLAPGEVEMCYEAGVCGFALQRQIEAQGVTCKVIAPTLVPVEPGRRIKTDRRDARQLARLLRAELLTEVHAPNEAQEAVRDLVRSREAAGADLLRSRHRVSKFLLRRARVYRDGRAWTQKHFRWLSGLEFAHATDAYVFEHALVEVLRRQEQVQELTEAVEAAARQAPYAEAVGWLRCFRGIDTLTAMTVVVELHGFERFSSPRQLMSYLGLTPSERSSGDTQHKGGITKTGNRRVRRVLTEASWHQRRRPVTSQALRQRRAGQPAWVIQLADQAMHRLHRRYWHLVQKGKLPTKAVIAVAREFVGFLWAALYLRERSSAACRQRRPRVKERRERVRAREFFASRG